MTTYSAGFLGTALWMTNATPFLAGAIAPGAVCYQPLYVGRILFIPRGYFRRSSTITLSCIGSAGNGELPVPN